MGFTSIVSPVGSTLSLVRPVQDVAAIIMTTAAIIAGIVLNSFIVINISISSRSAIFSAAKLIHAEKLNAEDESGAAGNRAVIIRPISDIGRDKEYGLAAHLHCLQALGPSGNHTVEGE